jgi:SOS response regulatory protein OraA/RecX
VAVVTGLRELRGGRLAVELDGAPWRTLPVEVVARVRLVVGEELDRPRLRELARELRRARAVSTALRTVARRDLSSQRLRERLERRHVPPAEREEAVGVLERAGFVDDARYACRRAASLAERGHGDAAIRWRLEEEGVPPDLVAAAVGELEPEGERARRVIEARGPGVRTARELARRGFGEDAVESALGSVVADEAQPAVDSQGFI